MIFSKLINTLTAQKQEERQAELQRNLIRHEAKVGGQIFGPVPEGVKREFFCLDRHTWVWHEEWTDAYGKRQVRTTRYDVRPSGVLKAQDGQHYQHLTTEEALNFREAVKQYRQRVKQEIYSFV